MNAREYLQRYGRELQKIVTLEERIRALDDLFSVTQDMTSERVQSSPKPDKIGEIIAKKSDLNAELQEEIEASYDVMNEIEGTINRVPNGRYKLILYGRYICFMTWEKIAESMQRADGAEPYSERWLYILHKRALREVDKIINDV